MQTKAQSGVSGKVAVEDHYISCFDEVYLLVSNSYPETTIKAPCPMSYFTVQDNVHYESFAEDFGPYDLGTTYKFCEILASNIQLKGEGVGLALVIEHGPESLANAIFLMGAFLIMIRECTTEDICAQFEYCLQKAASFRDVTPGPQNFHLHIANCWGGLARARDLHWISFLDGSFNLDDYVELSNPLNADLHVVVPGKLIAMRGPRDLGPGVDYADVVSDDGLRLQRDFSPAHYAAILQQFDVSTVVRLNEPCYSKDLFQNQGFAFADLFFEDCTCPPPLVAAQFLALVEAVPGAVAVHCKSGLGRTGTLLCLYLMKAHGFSAREAMGWLRVVRPGSVMGPQQEFLCEREGVMRKHAARRLAGPAGPSKPCGGPCPSGLGGPGEVTAQRAVDDVMRFCEDRLRSIVEAAAAAAARPEEDAGDARDGRRASLEGRKS